VLVATRNPLNLGAAARAMSNFGFLQLRVVNPYEVAFREARSAVGASELLANAEEYASVAEAVADCSLVVGTTAGARRELRLPLKRLEQGAPLIKQRLADSPVALLFGSEKRGLANADFSHCHWLMHIPTRDEHVSMNLGQAVAVCLYELARDAQASSLSPEEMRTTAGEEERVTGLLMRALHLSGYLKDSRTASAEEKIRRLVRRLDMPAADADTWLGMFRQIAWKLEKTPQQ
jgi:tRNA/rRNA methyltransferase